MVLRRFDGLALDIHTDARSAKHAELQANPAATLHGWDAASRVQLRASGRASLHVADRVAGEAWAALRPATRATYRVMPGPGTPLHGPANPTPDAGEADAQAVFCVVRLVVTSVDWLWLGDAGHRRARFAFAGEAVTAAWVVP